MEDGSLSIEDGVIPILVLTHKHYTFHINSVQLPWPFRMAKSITQVLYTLLVELIDYTTSLRFVEASEERRHLRSRI